MVGRHVHTYTIEAALDKERFQGRDAQTGRTALLQRLPDISDEIAAVVESELSRLEALRPPGIADVFGVHREDDGLWVISALLEGPTLSEQLRSRPLEISGVGALAVGLLGGLAQAHASRLVHRDIHPARIQMTPFGPRLTGFGVTLTEGRSVHYMAPELWSTRKHPSPASDVYALGVTLYEALTGALPFPRGLPRSTYAQLHSRQGVPHVSERRPETPAWLADAIYTATRIKPADRFADAGAMLQFIQAAQAAPRPTAPKPAAAPAPKAAAPAPKAAPAEAPAPDAPKKSRGLAALGCVAVPLLGIAGIGLIGGGWWASQQPGGVGGLLHEGPVLLVDNPSSQRITISCTAGPDEARIAGILEAGESEALLIPDVPVSCTAFNDARETLVNWGTDTLPGEGDVWQMSVGELNDTGLFEDVEPVVEEPEPEAEDTGLTLEEGIVEAIEEPEPAPRPRAPRPAPKEPEVEEPEASMAPVTIRADSAWKRWSKNVEIYVDGLSVGTAPRQLGLEPGTHTVRWFRENRVDHTCTVEVGPEGGTITIDPAEPRCP